MSSQLLFRIPVPTTKGTITCSSPAERTYLLTFNSPPDNRLTSAFIDAFMLALDIIQQKYPKGVVITTSAIEKFYSNGLDLEHMRKTPYFFANKLNKLCERLLTYAMPTVALLNGHTFAGGFFIAIFQDYRIQNPDRGFCCLNEIDIGLPIPLVLLSVFREKVTSSQVLYSTILEGRRFKGPEALESGLVDGLGGLQEAIKFAQERKLATKAETGVWGMMKEGMYSRTLALLKDPKGVEEWCASINAAREEAGEQREGRVSQWEKESGGAKL